MIPRRLAFPLACLAGVATYLAAGLVTDRPPVAEITSRQETADPLAVAPLEQVSRAVAPSPTAPLAADVIYELASPAVVKVETRDRQDRVTLAGSGFVVSRTGLIVTNYHVIEGAYAADVILPNKKRLSVLNVAARDQEVDVAILSVSARLCPGPLELANRLPRVGEKVFAIGAPLGLANTLSDGLVSGHRERPRGVSWIQTTAPISPGSSGGPLLDTFGKVVGITTAIWQQGQNINFAVPVSEVARMLERCKEGEPSSGFPPARAAARPADSPVEGPRGPVGLPHPPPGKMR